MDRLRRLLGQPSVRAQEYEPIADDGPPDSPGLGGGDRRGSYDEHTEEAVPFSWLEYSIFALLGVAMLWAWYVVLQSPRSNLPATEITSRYGTMKC